MGLVILGGLALYLLISIAVAIGAIKHAKKTGKSTKRWGWGAVLVMYLIPFWDWMPTVAVHQYYCKTEAGFWVYKTVDQWKAENPGVAETFIGRKSSPQVRTANGYYYYLNQRFRWEISHQETSFWLKKSVSQVTDTMTNQVIASLADFSTGQASGRLEGAREFRDLKFWMYRNSCEPDGQMVFRKNLINLFLRFRIWGRGNDFI